MSERELTVADFYGTAMRLAWGVVAGGMTPVVLPRVGVTFYLMHRSGASQAEVASWAEVPLADVAKQIRLVMSFMDYPSVAQAIGVALKHMPTLPQDEIGQIIEFPGPISLPRLRSVQVPS